MTHTDKKNMMSLYCTHTLLILFSFNRTLQSIQRLLWTRDCLQQSEDKCSDAKKKLDVRIILQFVTAGKLCLDITQAVSCLPEGWLWGERIGATKVAAIATSSSVIGLVLYFAKKRLLK